MQGLFEGHERKGQAGPLRASEASWPAILLGFIGSAIIVWIALNELTPIIANSWGFGWIANVWARSIIALVIALPIAALLARIEGTIWERYYVIVGFLLSLGLIIWIVLRLLKYL